MKKRTQIGYIYKIVINHPNHPMDGMFYIGKHGSERSPVNFWSGTGMNYLGSSVNKQFLAYKKEHGIHKITKFLISEHYTNKDLNKAEVVEISKYFRKDKLNFNGHCNGRWNANGRPLTQSQRDGIIRSNKSRVYTEETKRKISASISAIIRQPHTEERKRKIGLSHKGMKYDVTASRARITAKHKITDARIVLETKIQNPTLGSNKLQRLEILQGYSVDFVRSIVMGVHYLCESPELGDLVALVKTHYSPPRKYTKEEIDLVIKYKTENPSWSGYMMNKNIPELQSMHRDGIQKVIDKHFNK